MQKWHRLGITILVLVFVFGGWQFLHSASPPPADSPVQTVSYNHGAAARYHSPLSSMGMAAVNGVLASLDQPVDAAPRPQAPGSSDVAVNALRFTSDSSYMPQSETSIAVDPKNTRHVVGGFNDARYFFCGRLPTDCPSGYTISVSGFTVSADGGSTVLKSGNIPGLNATVTNRTGASATEFLASWGDPSVAAGEHGEFFYASLLISTKVTNGIPSFANGIEVAVSNSSLFDPAVACLTPRSAPARNPCWTAKIVTGNFTTAAGTFEDKELIAVDRNASSPFHGYIYVAWDHFTPRGTSESWVARCSPALSCEMIAGGFAPNAHPPLSGSDLFAAFTTPTVGTDAAAHFTWCNYGTATSLGPISCRVRSTAPNGGSIGANTVTVLTFDGATTMFPTYHGVLGYATEQFRSFSIPVIAADPSALSKNLYFTIEVCTSGNYYNFHGTLSPGNCGGSSVLFSRSTDGGVTWSPPAIISLVGLNIQPWVTADPLNGNVVVAYYTTRFDSFNHRTDVVVSVSTDQGQTFKEFRVTNVSNEPNADPGWFNNSSPFGGSFFAPQFGDYLQAVAIGGQIWILFTGNYASELGTLQTDPWLAITAESSPFSVTASANPNPAGPGINVAFSATAVNPAGGVTYTWAFGDGGTASTTSPNTVHAYSAAGTYVAGVTVRDSLGRTATAQLSVTVTSVLVARMALSPEATDVLYPVVFSATSAGGTGTYTYAWSFGDGTPVVRVPNTFHAYASPRTYQVVLWVNDSSGSSVKQLGNVTVNPLPIAAGTASPSPSDVGSAIGFSGSVTGGTAPLTYAWNFDDESSSNALKANHTYGHSGKFMVTFTATDAIGVLHKVTIVVTVNAQLVFTPTASTNRPTVADDVSFNVELAGGTPPFTYDWAFGDNEKGNAQNTTHRFHAPGVYNVHVTVTDAVGAAPTHTVTIAVAPLPESTLTTSSAIAISSLTLIASVVGTALVMTIIQRRRQSRLGRWRPK